ncbi:Sodium/pantothenate symporter [Botrimarina colliarenosi]|uniref:Sodium/pantothenate symporter n=1 Tax=Botrimarina colliarenosi TaxID=2528001 RepID=A0A5C6ABZ6_9BACT|nr:sodium:solute symporter family protein [Botrimarina colliarenosi]TWT97544.1 Sodium/pantothenate symporter [Botrimarina colliarenosi]
MTSLDYAVVGIYFALVTALGLSVSSRVRSPDDYFLGGRGFGKLLQTFAAFGAGTGSGDPVNAARTVYTGGASGMWSVMYWLFMTPFYWITAVWYRRMRHVTLGDWFVERYESPRLGAAYATFGVIYFVVYASMLLSAIGKVAAPLIGATLFEIGGLSIPIEYLLVPAIGAVVLVYGLAGGLHAAYLTDLAQGICIILLSVLLVPFGLMEMVRVFGGPESQSSLLDGFTLMHEQLDPSDFQLFGGADSQFTVAYLTVVVLLNLAGVVIQPHFIATGGGSAKSEYDARVGLVVGNLLKRLCTIGWVLVGLIALSLFGDDPLLIDDPDKTWGIASARLLGPGLTGLMLSCLLAALMSSVDAYMITGSALIVRNLYTTFIDPDASERRCLLVAKITGAAIVLGAVAVSLTTMDVFAQLQLTWVIPVLFAAPFWVGMYWRGATTAGVWATIAFGAIAFFILPALGQEVSLVGLVGVDLSGWTANSQETVQLAETVVAPFVVMIVASLLTPKNSPTTLDRYYTKMRTPVDPDPQTDKAKLEATIAGEQVCDIQKLFPNTPLEFNRPTRTDAVGFVVLCVTCGLVIGLAKLVFSLGS